MSAGMVTSATVRANGLGSDTNICDTGVTSLSMAICSAAASEVTFASSYATVSYGNVSAFIQGSSFGRGSGASASASATFTDTFTINGGTGLGVLTIHESVWRFGSGSLFAGSTGVNPVPVSITENFLYGVPFTVTLTALASSSFIGSYCDGGSLLVQARLDSVTFKDGTGAARNVMTASTPEPSTWVLALIGAGLLLVSRKLARENAAPQSGENQQGAEGQGARPRWSVKDGDLR